MYYRDLYVRKTNPTVMRQRNSWKIRRGVKYFMRDVTFGANSLSIRKICSVNAHIFCYA